jgi:alkanesulfonate monooxygenase SsuD/methylene tetrahydromethanopterin reductase-like flavin-dependent oxidoreductase (luciferase family)
MTPPSILDLVRIIEDTGARGGLDVTVHAEAWAYRRIWVAEHNHMPGIVSAATSVFIGHIAARTKTIRVGREGAGLRMAESRPCLCALHSRPLTTARDTTTRRANYSTARRAIRLFAP